jgi:hypothetical protein
MFEQKAFIKQHKSVFNGRVDTNRYASAFDSASLEPTLTPSRSTDLQSESASYHNVSFADNLNPTSAMDADMPAGSMANIDFTQVVNTTLNTEVAPFWNQATAWNRGTGTDSSNFSGIRPAGFDWKKFGHGALDVVGALPIPVVSTAADLANAGWYAAEGDYKNAAMSAVGAVPGVGDGAKLAIKAADAARTARSTRTTASLTTRATPSRPPRPGLAPTKPERPGVAPDPKPSARKPEPTVAPRRESSGRPDPNPVVTPASRSTPRRPEPIPSGALKKPDPKRPDPQPGPTTAKKPEPSRPEGNPTPSGTREQPPRPEGQPAPVATKEPQIKSEPRPETRGLSQGNRNGDLTRIVHGSGSQRTGGRSTINDNLLRAAHGGGSRTARDESLTQVGQRTGVRSAESGGFRQGSGTTVESSGSPVATNAIGSTAIRNTAAATTVALASIGLAGSTENSSTTTSPTWQRQENPITGRPYQTQQEYDQVQSLQLTGAQEDRLETLARNSRYNSQLIPNLTRDQRTGCISATLPGHLGSTPNAPPARYATQVSQSSNDFYVLSPSGRAEFFDGRTPLTRHVWEAKHGYGRLLADRDSLRDYPLQENVEDDMNYQAMSQQEVAQDCRYNLTWAFSNGDVRNYFHQTWEGDPSKPQDVRHIPYQG